MAIIFNNIFQFNCRQECYADGKVLNLRYYLKLNVDATPHTALGDILVLEALFNRIYAKAVIEFGDDTVAKMIEVSKNPVFYRRMPFGKHKGLKMEEVPVDYLQWLSGTDLEEDLRYTIEQYLNF